VIGVCACAGCAKAATAAKQAAEIQANLRAMPSSSLPFPGC
jgi:hypothetical protein